MRLIDADALFLHLRGNRGKETGSYSKGRNNGINIAIGAIRNEQICPTVDAVPVVHGRWILEREPNGKPYSFHCSVCDDDFHRIGYKITSDYCPNCGAKMDGGDEE